MDTLIKNMDMPKNCEECPLYDNDEEMCRREPMTNNLHYMTRFCACPLVALPSHGDLIDANAFKKRNKDARMEKKLKNGTIQIIELGDIFAYFIAKEPVILESTE